MSSEGLRVFEAGGGRALDVAGIERDLASIWKEASAAGKVPAMRACCANLLVILDATAPGADAVASGVERLLPAIAHSHPSRVLLVRAGLPGDRPPLSASASALCFLGAGARYLCCERILIDVAAGCEPSIAGVVNALLVGDMPLIVWFAGNSPGSPSFTAPWLRPLVRGADRLLLDSAEILDPVGSLERLRSLTKGFGRITLSDFEWLRLAPWRRRIARAFDPPDARSAARAGVDRVVFVEAAAGAVASARFLLETWMSSRLTVGGFSSERATAGIAPAAEANAPAIARGLAAIRLEGRRDGAAFTLEIDAPRLSRPPLPAEYASLLGGQPDNPLAYGERS